MSRFTRRILAPTLLLLTAASSLTVGVAGPSDAADTTATDAKPSITLVVRDSKLGPIITDDKGMTLYMFTPDARNVSNCEGACLNVWPPVMLKSDETLSSVGVDGNLRRSKLGVAMRFDGSRQVTYNGFPLYWWVRDKTPGDITGQWVGNVWFVLNDAGTPNSVRI